MRGYELSNLHPSVESWLLKLAEEDPMSADLVEAAVDMPAKSIAVLAGAGASRARDSVHTPQH
jgi:hypothetical protein